MVLLSSSVFLLIFCPVDVSFLIEGAVDSTIIVDLSISTYNSIRFLLHAFLLSVVTQKNTLRILFHLLGKFDPLSLCRASLTSRLFLFLNQFYLGYTKLLLLLDFFWNGLSLPIYF